MTASDARRTLPELIPVVKARKTTFMQCGITASRPLQICEPLVTSAGSYVGEAHTDLLGYLCPVSVAAQGRLPRIYLAVARDAPIRQSANTTETQVCLSERNSRLINKCQRSDSTNSQYRRAPEFN